MDETELIRKAMQALGRRTSARKAQASRDNGRKSKGYPKGRPRQAKTVPTKPTLQTCNENKVENISCKPNG